MRAAAGMLAVAPLGVLAAALVAAPAVAAEGDRGGDLTVTVDSVSFDASRLSGRGGWLGYVVTAPDGSHARNLGDGYSSDDAADGVLELDVPTRGAYADGYCITWAMVTGMNDQFAGWDGDAAVCTTSQEVPSPTTPPAPDPTSPPATTDAAPVGDVPAPSPEQPAQTAPADAPAVEPDPSPEPTAEPTTEAPVDPSPTSDPTTASPEPSRTPLVSAAERMAPPPPSDPGFPALAVVGVGGLVAAAAGGAILLVRRVG
jgi:hypothetical protein